ncbi:ALA-interacting subunit 3, partial [Dionaea muscipula]
EMSNLYSTATWFMVCSGLDLNPNNLVGCITFFSKSTRAMLCLLSEQEDLIVWMRTAALPTFRMLYGRIEQDLQANDLIHVTLENNYNTYSFGGKKMLVLSIASRLGGKNDFLGIAYLTVDGMCFFLAMFFALIYLLKPRYVCTLHITLS